MVLLTLTQISTRFDNWDKINDLLPPSKYPSGPGVVESMRLRRPTSCPELTKLAEEGAPGVRWGWGLGLGSVEVTMGREDWRSVDSSCTRRAQPGWGSSPTTVLDRLHLRHVQDTGRRGGSLEHPGGRRRSLDTTPRAVLHHAGSCPRLAGWELDEQVRRRSIAVGQLLYHRQKETEGALWDELSLGASPPGLTAAEALRLSGRAAGSPGSPGWAGAGDKGAGRSGQWAGGTATTGSRRNAWGGDGGGGTVSSTASGSSSTMKRTKSSGALQPARTVSLPGSAPSGSGSGAAPPWLGLMARPGGFDASPLEFGGASTGGGQRGSRGVAYLSSQQVSTLPEPLSAE